MDTRATGTAPDPVALSGAERLRSRADAEAYVASVCFKHGPPRLVGVELEWLVHPAAAPAAPVEAAALRAALGPHAPPSLDPRSPARPLPGGSTVTRAPGGQVELASPPLHPLGRLVRTVAADVDVLHARLAAHGLAVAPRAADPLRPPRRVLDLPRYRAMEARFDRFGPAGRSGMCSTAAVQVCLDAGEGPGAVAERWATLHALGPVLLAAFANSPVLHGRRTGWKSSRMACWLTLDPARTAPPPVADREPATDWARRVVDTELLCVRRAGSTWDPPAGTTFGDWVDGALDPPPTRDDLDYHVSTLFPPVRPHGHLEVRFVDAQAGREWALPVAVLAALLSTPDTARRARAACAPAAGRWVSAARHGLADRVVHRAAVEVFELAVAALPALEPPTWLTDDLVVALARRVRRGLCPADLPAPGDPAPGVPGPPPSPAPFAGDPEEARS